MPYVSLSPISPWSIAPQVKDYNYDSPGFSTATGHFTQVVWKDTTYLGCAVNTNCEWATYLCQYRAPGNVLSLNWTEQVLRPSARVSVTTASCNGSGSTNMVPRHTPVRAPASPSAAAPMSAALTKPRRHDSTTNSTAPRPPTSAALLSADATAALTRHNLYRQRHQVANLVWDDAIAASAAKWVAGCPRGHSGYAGVGENMAWATSMTVEGMVDMWYNEVSSVCSSLTSCVICQNTLHPTASQLHGCMCLVHDCDIL